MFSKGPKKGPNCSGCPWEKKGSDYIGGIDGGGDVYVLAIFEKPGSHEVGDCKCEPGKHEVGVPLVGPTGRIVETSLAGWQNVYRTNVRKCLAKAKDADEDAATIDFCTKAYLTGELEKLERAGTVRAVVLGGADAAEQFYGAPAMAEISRNGGAMAKLTGATLTLKELEAIAEATK